MKKDPNYTLTYLDGVPYLLPFGQNVADHRRGLRLDDTGVFLWKALDQSDDINVLTDALMAHAGANGEERDAIRMDVGQLLGLLASCGILYQPLIQPPLCQTLSIAGLRIALRGKAEYFPEEFLPFIQQSGDSEGPDQTVSVTEISPPTLVRTRLLLENQELAVYENLDRWVLRFPQSADLLQLELNGDGTRSNIHVRPPRDREGLSALRTDIFHAFRHIFLFLAQRRRYFALHSASILYRDRAWLFSGPSGTGKSTQAGLWQDAFGVSMLNGDLNLLSFQNENGYETPDKVYVHGIPWCGTSGVCTTRCVELGGIILLRQAPENRLEPLLRDQKQLYVANRLISPVWTQDMLKMNLAFTGELSRRAAVWRFHCTKEPAAAEYMRREVDQYLEGVKNP